MSFVKSDWTDEITNYDKEGEPPKEKVVCHFVESDKQGNTKRCWFKPSPVVCQICLLGQLADNTAMLEYYLDKINDILEE